MEEYCTCVDCEPQTKPKVEICGDMCTCDKPVVAKYHPSIAGKMKYHSTLAELVAKEMEDDKINDISVGVARLLTLRAQNSLNHN